MSTSSIPTRPAQRVLSEEFLSARSKILDLAATLDRLDRAQGSVEQAPALNLLNQGLHILCDDETDKAKRIQLLMSRPYEKDWPQTMGFNNLGS